MCMTAVMSELTRAGIVQYTDNVIMIHAAYVRSRDVPTFWKEPPLEALCAQEEAHLSINQGKEVKNAERFSHAISSAISKFATRPQKTSPMSLKASMHYRQMPILDAVTAYPPISYHHAIKESSLRRTAPSNHCE